MKKIISYALMIIIGILVAVILFTNGKRKTSDDHHVIDALGDIKAYKSNITIEVINDREINKYEGVQVYKKNIGYKLDLNDNRSFTFKNDQILVKDSESTRDYTLDKEFDEVFKYGFIGEFIGLIYTNEKLDFKTETIGNHQFFIISTLIPGSNNNLYQGSLYYDVNEYVPKKIVIYDNNHRERVIYTYENFNWTDEVQEVELDL